MFQKRQPDTALADRATHPILYYELFYENLPIGLGMVR